MCDRLVGLPEVNLLAVVDQPDTARVVHVESRPIRVWLYGLRDAGMSEGRPSVMLADLPGFGRPARLVWRKHRWRCHEPTRPHGPWTDVDDRIAAPRS